MKMFSRITALLAVSAITACADLALEPDNPPGSMELSPADTLIREGDVLKLRLTVIGEDGTEIKGPPSWAAPEWLIRDGQKDAITITRDGSVTALMGAQLRVQARVADMEAWADLRINPNQVVLTAPAIYLNQAAQNREGSVPIIAGRRALLRVFATGDQVSFYEPKVRADFYQNNEIVYTTVMEAFSDQLPRFVDEGRLDRSYNAVIPGEVLQPGVEIVVDLDAEGVVPLAPGSQRRIPETGRMQVNIIEMPMLRQTIVPVLVRGIEDQQVFNWTRGLTANSRNMQLTRTILPVGDMQVTVPEPFITTANLATYDGWLRLLQDIHAKHLMEGYVGYYYGVVVPQPGSGIGGLGYLQLPTSVGVPNDGVYTHELGHNMNLSHAPCGGAGGPDPSFPYSDGSSGVWGYNFERSRLVDPKQFKDVMGYCSPDWISDYHFMRAMYRRLSWNRSPVEPEFDGEPASRENVLLLWGRISDSGEMMMEPAFAVEAPVRLPESGGAYRLEGLAQDGSVAFAYNFEPYEVDHGGAHFLFGVPYDLVTDGPLDRVILTGPDGDFVLRRSDDSRMAMVINRTTGELRAILRDWNDTTPLALEAGFEVLVSNGLPGEIR